MVTFDVFAVKASILMCGSSQPEKHEKNCVHEKEFR